MDILPDEMLLEVFGRCRRSALFHAQFVNRKWFALAFRSSTSLEISPKNTKPTLWNISNVFSSAMTPKEALDRISSRYNPSKILSLSTTVPSIPFNVGVLNLCNNVQSLDIVNVADFKNLKSLKLLRLTAEKEFRLPSNIFASLEEFEVDLIGSFVLSDNFSHQLSKSKFLKKFKYNGSPLALGSLVSELPKISSLTSIETSPNAAQINEFLQFKYPNLTNLTLNMYNESYEINSFSGFPRLESLCLYGHFSIAPASPADPSPLEGLSLKRLQLLAFGMRSETLVMIKCLSKTLEDLEIRRYNPIWTRSDKPFFDCLVDFNSLRRLNFLFCFDVANSQNMILEATKNKPNLRDLTLFFNYQPGSDILDKALPTLKHLETFDIQLPRMDDAVFSTIGKFTYLRSLSIRYTFNEVDFEFFREVLVSLKELRSLTLQELCSVPKEKDHFEFEYFFETINMCKNLDRIDLRKALDPKVTIKDIATKAIFLSEISLNR